MLAELILHYFTYDPATGEIRWRVNSGKKVAGRLLASSTTINLHHAGRLFRLRPSHIAWCHITGNLPAAEIDHKDGNQLNNTAGNLRECSHRQNQYNRVPHAFGVVFMADTARSRPYRARIRMPDGRRKNIGDFATRAEAEAAYKNAAKELHGDFYFGAP